MSRTSEKVSWSLRTWLRKHFTNPLLDSYESLLALSERTTWSLKHIIGRIVTFVREAPQQHIAKPRISSFLPNVEPLEVRYLPSTSTWTGGGSDTNWTTAANWNNGVPGTGDTAIINGTVTVNSTVQIANIQFSGGTISSSGGTLELTGSSSTWTGGTLGPLTLTVDTGATLAISGASTKTMTVLQLADYGVVSWTQGDISSVSPKLPSFITVESGGVWTMAAGLDAIGPKIFAFTNNGTVNVGGAGSVGTNTWNGTFLQNSTGVLNIELQQASGSLFDQLDFSSTVSLNGSLRVRPIVGTDIQSGDSYAVLAGSSISGSFSTVDVSGFSKGINAAYNSTNVTLQVNDVGESSLAVDPLQTEALQFGSYSVVLQTGNLHADVPAAQDYSPLEQDELYYYPGLEYNSDTASPKPLIGVSVKTTVGLTPNDIKARLTWNGSVGSWVTFDMPGSATAGATYDLSLQVPSAVSSTGYYPFSVDVEVDYPSGSTTQTISDDRMVVVNGATPYGPGWTLADENYLVFNGSDVILVRGNGGYSYFTNNGGTFTGPGYDTGSLTSSGGNYTYTDANKLQWNYNGSGKLTSVVDLDGLTVAYSYDGSGRLSSVLDPNNNEVVFDYSGGVLTDIKRGYVSSSTFYGYATSTFAYDGTSGDLTAATDPEGNVRTFTYNSDHKLLTDGSLATIGYTYGAATSFTQGSGLSTSTITPQLLQGYGEPSATYTAVMAGDFAAQVTDGNSHTTKYQTDSSGRLLAETLPGGGVSSLFTRDDAGNPLTSTDLNGNVTTMAYAPGTHDVTSVITPDGLTTIYQYDASLNEPTAVIDGYGRTTLYKYDTGGDITATIYPDGTTSLATYFAGLIQTSVDPIGNTTTYSYDANRRLTEIVDPVAGTTQISYDLATGAVTTIDSTGATSVANYNLNGQVASRVDGLGHTISPSYDAYGRPTSSVNALGQTSYQQYDSAGRETATIDASGATTKQFYDGANQVTATVDANGRTAFTYYDANGWVTATIDALGHTTLQKYDTAGNVTATIDALGRTSLQDYDSTGLLTASVDALGKTTFYDYDTERRLTATIDPLGHTTKQIYDTAGHVTATVDANNHTSNQYYDSLDQVTASVDALGKSSFTYYDANGQVTATVDANNHTSRMLYDGSGRVTASVDRLGHTSFTDYDAAGRVTASVDANGKTAFTYYDANGQVTASVDANAHTTRQLYDANAQVTASVDALGKTSFTDYDADGRVTATVDANGKTAFTYYDSNGQATANVDVNGHTTRSIYDADGRVTASVDALGKTSFTDYDAAGQVTATVDANGKTSFTLYDNDGRVTASVDANGHTSFTLYDDIGRATASVDALGKTSYTDYDAVGQATATVDALGKTSFTDYDADGRVTASVDANGKTSFTSYDAIGQATASVDANGHTSFTYYDANNQVTATVDGLGKTSFTDYDADGRVTAMVDANGLTTRSLYDADGRVTASVDALANTSYTDYDVVGRMTATVDVLGKTSFMDYDADGRVTASVDANGKTSFTSYDSVGNATQTIDANGLTTTNAYDAANRLTQFIDGVGRTAHIAYDADDRITQSIDVHGYTTLNYYDAIGNTTEVFDAAGFASYTSYDAANQPTMSIDGNGHTSRQLYDADNRITATVDGNGYTSFMKYDAIGQMTASIDAAGATTQFQYDGVGNKTAVIDPDSNTTTMAFDADNRLTQTITPASGTTTQAYDAAGNLTQTVQADGGSIVYSYDADDRETQQVWYDSSHATVDTQNRTYDDDGRLLSASNSNGTYSFSYDNNGQATQVVEPFGVTLHYSYDGIGNQTQVVDSLGGTQTSTYDVENRLTSRTYAGQGQQLREDYTYGPLDRVATDTRYSDLAGISLVASSDYAYDGDGRTTSMITYDATPSVIDNFAYTYDAAGNLATKTENGDYTYYNYDHSNQLTLAGFLASGSMTYVYSNYGYDAAGNRNTGGSTPTTGNQLTTDGVWNYTYDAKGNVIQKDSVTGGSSEHWTYAYDNRNLITQAKHYNSSNVLVLTATYKYNVFGNLIEESVTTGAGTTTSRYVVDGWNPAKPAAESIENFDIIAVLDGSSSLTSRYFYGDAVNQSLARVDVGVSNTTYWSLTDRLGSVRTLVDNSGSVFDAIAYDSFGVMTESSPGGLGIFGFTGSLHDSATSFQINGFRWYDPATGRWMQTDPIGFDGGDANLYRYVGNNPATATDPSGQILVAADRIAAEDFQSDFRANYRIPSARYVRLGTDGRYVFNADIDEVNDALRAGATPFMTGVLTALKSPYDNFEVWSTQEGAANRAGTETAYYGKPATWYNRNWISNAERSLWFQMTWNIRRDQPAGSGTPANSLGGNAPPPPPVQSLTPPQFGNGIQAAGVQSYELTRAFREQQRQEIRDLFLTSIHAGAIAITLIPIPGAAAAGTYLLVSIDLSQGNYGSAAFTVVTFGAGAALGHALRVAPGIRTGLAPAGSSYGSILQRSGRTFDGVPTMLAGDFELFGRIRASTSATSAVGGTAQQVFGRALPANVQVFIVEGGIQVRAAGAGARSITGATVVGNNRTVIFLTEAGLANPVVLADEVGHLLVSGTASNFHHRVSFRMLDRAVRNGGVTLTAQQQAELLEAIRMAGMGH